ncbi:glycosyltransferase [Paraburkholderia tagetis]|uniref:Glycosyltransferase n=1 Tax=Paraburkholderia tagetis TaxID=2913261 RepID=A0A9X1RQP7_9BURK|nr:glycosyltransferase [Paraburkholderia tagetis]MCG5075495.1 glycosyltransferase [Paraburkholderia tagetis]
MSAPTREARQAHEAHQAHEVHKRAPRVLLSPFTNTTNPYIDLQKQLLRDIGYEVRPLSLRYLLRGGFVDLFRRSTVLMLHWLELRAFVDTGRGVVPRLRGVPVVLLYCALMALGRARVVCFVHDHAVHNARGAVRVLSVALMSLVRWLADVRIVHDPHYAGHFRARYLPHPLYWDVPGRAAQTTQTMHAARDGMRKPSFAILGTVEPYKGIAQVLAAWPAGHTLLIAGRAQAAYVDALHAILHERDLSACVTLDARFLSDAEFDERISAADVLILPHVADSMLVSGAFFEAIGRVPVVIGRAIPFMQWVAEQFDNVLLFEHEENLPEVVRFVTENWPRFSAAQTVAARRQHAIDMFGWETCRQQYRECFDACEQHSRTLRTSPAVETRS